MREAAHRGYNLTEVAQALHTSQPGVSRQIRELEAEFQLPLFTRSGKRLTGMTAPGERLLVIVERLLEHADRLRNAGREYTAEACGRLGIAATHSQARYALPHAVYDFRAGHPDVQLHLHQGSPQQVAQLLLDGTVDVGIATEALAQVPGLVTLPCYQWTHVVLVPHDHPLADGQALTLERLARHPLVTYEPGFTGRANIDRAFAAAGLQPQLALEAMDADVIKTYVDLGIGVGVIASVAFDEARDGHLTALDARDLFAINTTRVAIKRGAYLRGYVLDFIQTFAPTLTRQVVEEALSSTPPG